jgi:hypothetical protein
MADLNIQTVRTIIEESNNFPSNETAEKTDNIPAWQSSMLTQFPEKAASYNRHFRTIMLSTGAEVVREARRQYESCGSQVNAIFADAVEKATATSTRTIEKLADNIAQPVQDPVDATVKAVESSASEALSQGTQASDDFVAAIQAPLQTPTKSGNKR